MKGYAVTHLDSNARESFRCNNAYTCDRLINILTIFVCLVSIFMCYYVAKSAEEKYNKSIMKLQSRLSALELQLQSKVSVLI